MADELPDINAVKPEDPGYVEFLDNSLRAIEGIIENERDLVEIKSVDDLVSMISGKMEKIRGVYQRLAEFQKALLRLTKIEAVHEINPDAAKAMLLFAGSDGIVYESFLDLEKGLAMGGKPLSGFSASDVGSEEGRKMIRARYQVKNIYFASTPSTSTPHYEIGKHAAGAILTEFDKRHPDIAKKRKAPQEHASGIAGTVIGLAANLMPLVMACKKPETILAMEQGKNPMESYYKINCTPCEFRGECTVYTKLNETYGQGPKQKKSFPERMGIPPHIIPPDASFN